MAFKRYDGFTGSIPQKKMDKGLTKCPFCGNDPHWLLEIKQGFATASMTCMCEKCGAKLYSENSGFNYDDNLRVVDTGNVNKNNLNLNAIYHITALNTLGNKTNLNSEYVKANDNITMNKVESTPQIGVIQSETMPNTNKKTGIISGSIVSAIVFIAIMFWIFMPLGGYGQPGLNDLQPVMQSSMHVEEIMDNYYSVTITGSAKNTSNKMMDYVSITFTLYDSAGNVVGNALDNQANLGAGQTWVYSAIGISTTNRPVSWESTDVTVLCY